MDIANMTLTPDEQAFRDKVRRFYAENLTPELRRAAQLTTWTFPEFEYGKAWQKILNAHGWGAPNWPREHGGAGWTPRERLIWELETAQAQPPEVMRMGRDYAAPCIIRFGTQEQKDFFLPRILNGEDWWAQGYSEPGAGSDLASLQLAAVSDGDDYVLNGSKIWTTFAHHANRIFLLARTAKGEKKQFGITFLLIDMDSQGIEIRPIINLAGLVRATAELRRRAAWVRSIAIAEPDGHGGALIDEPHFARKLARLEIGVEAADFAADQLLLTTPAGSSPGAGAELLTVRNRELDQTLTELAAEAVSYYGLPSQLEARKVETAVDPIGPDHALMPMPIFFGQRGATIAGGTPDVHRNNLARHLLRHGGL